MKNPKPKKPRFVTHATAIGCRCGCNKLKLGEIWIEGDDHGFTNCDEVTVTITLQKPTLQKPKSKRGTK